ARARAAGGDDHSDRAHRETEHGGTLDEFAAAQASSREGFDRVELERDRRAPNLVQLAIVHGWILRQAAGATELFARLDWRTRRRPTASPPAGHRCVGTVLVAHPTVNARRGCGWVRDTACRAHHRHPSGAAPPSARYGLSRPHGART